MLGQKLYELTTPQKSIWNLEQFYKNTPVNNIGGTIIIKEKIDFIILEQAINKFIELNDSFNIRLHYTEEGTIKQFFSNFTYNKFDLINLNSYADLQKREKELAEYSFSLLNAPLYNFTMFKFPDGTGGIIMIVHHLIADAFSCNLTGNGIAYIYNCIINNLPMPIYESYKDYIEKEPEYINSNKFEKDKKYWEEVFETIPELVTLSTKGNKTVSAVEDISSKRETFIVEKELLNKIDVYCKENKISRYNFFMAVYSLYIGKINNINDFVIGTPILNRTNFKEKKMTGMFINTVPLRFVLKKDFSFKEYLAYVYSQSMDMLRHQKYSYEYILDQIRAKKSNIPSIYNILLSYQIGKSNPTDANINYTVNWTHADVNSDELDIHLFEYDDCDNSLNIAYDYQTKKFSKDDIYSLHERIINIINQVISTSQIQLSEIKLVTEEEENFILNKYNTQEELNIDKTVIDMFEEQATRTPNNIAIVKDDLEINYSNLNNMVNYLATFLINMGVQKGDNICLFFNNSIELVTSILAVLKLSCTYIPIDTNYPENRIEYLLKNSNSKFILTNSLFANKLNKNICNCIILSLEDIIKASSLKDYPNLLVKPTLDCNAYIIYTSGSTGNPKGVQINHENLANYINFASIQYVQNEVCNFPLYSSIAFDLTVTSVYTPICTGNTIYIYENSNPELLLKQIIEDKKVQIVKLTPAHLSLLKEINLTNSIIKKLVVGGDILSIQIASSITKLFNNNVLIYNEYGPTEATVGCMIYTYSTDDCNYYSSVPIGTPIINSNILVLNDDYNLIPLEYSGEMYIGGKCVSKGYLNLPEKTEKCFIPSPYRDGDILYSTGDISKLHQNGIMEYIGRKDFQVKINGYRIETGEIESKILSYVETNSTIIENLEDSSTSDTSTDYTTINTSIKSCYVTAIDIDDSKVLCAYFVSDVDINLNSLKNHLLESLPLYMVPKFFIPVNEIPLTVNGKVNKTLLPLPIKNDTVEYIPPSNELECFLHDTIVSILKIKKISVTQNLFDYLIDSLTIIKMQTKLYSLGINVDTQAFYNYPTIRDIANYIMNKSDKNLSTLSDIEKINIPEIRKINETKHLEYKNILFFGTTGFVGIHILHELLENTNAHIYCVIREKDNINSIERFKQKYSFYYNNLDEILDRITPVTGDLNSENFGLLDQTYNELSNTIDCVFSTAAIVKHFGNQELFYNTNVLGTQKIVDFCVTNNVPLHYISTLSISGYGLTTVHSAVFSENDFYINQNYEENIYVKTKFQAESIILNACKVQNLKASIYRIGNITNRYSDGVFQENASENAFLNRISSIINLKVVPRDLLNYKLEFTPVDCLANFIVKLCTNMEYNINIYHLFNNNYITFGDFINIIQSYGYKINLVSLDEFKNAIINSSVSSFGITNYLSAIANTEDSILIINNIYTNKLLENLGLNWPKINDEYINKILTYLKTFNFIGDTYEK